MVLDEMIGVRQLDAEDVDGWADIESELYHSAREACVECFPPDDAEDEESVASAVSPPPTVGPVVVRGAQRAPASG